MKKLLLWSGAALLAAGCDKPVEKPAPVEEAPKSDTRRRHVSSPAPGDDSKKTGVSAASPAEVDAYLGELEVLAKQVEFLEQPPAEGSPPPDIEALQETYTVLVKRRSELMSGMTIDEKRELAKRLQPSMKRVGPVLMKHRLAKARERNKNAPPAQSRQGTVPQELLEEMPIPPSEGVPLLPGTGEPPPR